MDFEELQDKIYEKLGFDADYKWGFDVIQGEWRDFVVFFMFLPHPFLITIGFWRWAISFGKQPVFADTSACAKQDYLWWSDSIISESLKSEMLCHLYGKEKLCQEQ